MIRVVAFALTALVSALAMVSVRVIHIRGMIFGF